MELFGIELGVGEAPPPLTNTVLLDFNEVYLKMFQAFQQNPNNRVVLAHWESTPEDGGLTCFGSFTLGRVWKNLAYMQLVKVRKLREPTDEINERTKKPKMRTLVIIEPNKLGYEVLEKGGLFNVSLWFNEETHLVGLGKPYSTFKELWDKIERMAVASGIARTRREKWYYEFKDFYRDHLAAKIREHAETEAIEFARRHIASAPRKRFAALKVRVEVHLSQRLEKWFK